LDVTGIYLCQPSYSHCHPTSKRQFWARANNPEGKYARTRRYFDDRGGSLLAHTFNAHWCNALNIQASGEPLSHFVMLHDDVVPEDWWCDKLLDDLDACNGDLVSAVIPIKDMRGLTSTAIDDPRDPWAPLRRLTMTEVMALPALFSKEHTSNPRNALLINTGCWVCHFTRSWRFHVHFEITNKIRYKQEDGLEIPTCEFHRYSSLPPGKWEAQVASEDWEFSRQLARFNACVYATRNVFVQHVGELPYPNDKVWGDQAYDKELEYKFMEGYKVKLEMETSDGSKQYATGIIPTIARDVGTTATTTSSS